MNQPDEDEDEDEDEQDSEPIEPPTLSPREMDYAAAQYFSHLDRDR